MLGSEKAEVIPQRHFKPNNVIPYMPDEATAEDGMIRSSFIPRSDSGVLIF